VLASFIKISSRHISSAQQERIAEVLAGFTTSPELELQQRAVEFASLFSLDSVKEGVLERMPPPELKATVMGVGEYQYITLRILFHETYHSERKQAGGIHRFWERSTRRRPCHSQQRYDKRSSLVNPEQSRPACRNIRFFAIPTFTKLPRTNSRQING
jgi:hypothetical protein